MDLTSLIRLPNNAKDVNIGRIWREKKQNLTERTNDLLGVSNAPSSDAPSSVELGRARTQEEILIDDLRRLKEDNRRAMDIAMIEGRLLAGRRLSKEELSFIRENAPHLYEQAVKVERERREYERAMANARSKEDVARIHKNKSMQFASEARTVMRSNLSQEDRLVAMRFIQMRMMAVNNSHLEFVQSPEYNKLPDECDFTSLHLNYRLVIIEDDETNDPVQFLNDLFNEEYEDERD